MKSPSLDNPILYLFTLILSGSFIPFNVIDNVLNSLFKSNYDFKDDFVIVNVFESPYNNVSFK